MLIGMNVSGPLRKAEQEKAKVFEEIKKTYPRVKDLNRHSFQYVTYSTTMSNKVYVFDHLGELVIKKDVNASDLEKVKDLVLVDYGIEDAQVFIGYGFDNVVYGVEDERLMVYFDYDDLEVVYYKGGLQNE